MAYDRLEDYYWYWLCNIPGLGRLRINRLLLELETAKNIYKCSDNIIKNICDASDELLKTIDDTKHDSLIYEEFLALERKNIRFVHRGSGDYPVRLKNIDDGPIGFYVKGVLPAQDRISAAIIGARGCTEYGRNTAHMLGKELAYMGIQVISGMALGIDAAGQRGCLDGGGQSYAVLGCGADICYPADNIGLYQRLCEGGGGIISEYPVGTRPNKGFFPERNRIISGLSDVVIVVEARKKSGSLITVDQALEQNKEIMAVPGRIGDPLSEGCNELIKLGAMVITCGDDIMQVDAVRRWAQDYLTSGGSDISDNFNNKKRGMDGCDNSGTESPSENVQNKNSLASEKNMVYSTTNLYPKDIDTIIKESGLDMAAVSRWLLELQLEGRIREAGKNCYVRSSI